MNSTYSNEASDELTAAPGSALDDVLRDDPNWQCVSEGTATDTPHRIDAVKGIWPLGPGTSINPPREAADWVLGQAPPHQIARLGLTSEVNK